MMKIESGQKCSVAAGRRRIRVQKRLRTALYQRYRETAPNTVCKVTKADRSVFEKEGRKQGRKEERKDGGRRAMSCLIIRLLYLLTLLILIE